MQHSDRKRAEMAGLLDDFEALKAKHRKAEARYIEKWEASLDEDDAYAPSEVTDIKRLFHNAPEELLEYYQPMPEGEVEEPVEAEPEPEAVE